MRGNRRGDLGATVTVVACVFLAAMMPRPAAAQDIDARVFAAAAVVATGVYAAQMADEAGHDHLTWSPSRKAVADWISAGTVAGGLLLPCAEKVVHSRFDCLKREGLRVGLTVASAEVVKRLVHRDRPDTSDRKSFFSEHTALACVGGLSSRRQLIGALLCGGTAYLRVSAEKHWISDVATGAIVGFVFTRVAR